MNENSQIKVGTLTFHMAHNYGAMLQAYALPIAVQRLGFECEVIDYRFPYIDSWSRIERWNDLIHKYGFWGGMIRYVNRFLHGYYRHDNMHIRFDAFERDIIPHSQKIYRNRMELNRLPYDVILFGSDQIWNSALTNGIADEYIGAFDCLPNTKKVAYAASCGTADFQDDSRAVYYSCLDDFYAISVREDGFQKTLLSRGYDAKLVIDPTLLLTTDDWKNMIPDMKKVYPKLNRYLLLYVFDEDEKLYDLTREYAQKHGLEIVVIAYKKKEIMYDMSVQTNCGPLEFLYLFSCAERVVTTSFHGTVFAILFHKNFHCIPHPKYHERTDSLLKMLNLENHNVHELTILQDIETNWDKVDQILDNQRKRSLSFLFQALKID